MLEEKKKPLVLCILDGWGLSSHHAHNALAQANLPTWNRWMEESPHTSLSASGEDVGLPSGQMGNSEVGHMTIGAGRVILQDLPRINKAFQDKAVETLPLMTSFLETLKKEGRPCHVMSLVSPGGIHSHQNHLEGFLQILADHKIPAHVHCFLDGRDTPPKSADQFLEKLQSFIQPFPLCSIKTILGRFYAMDRDQRWERTEAAFEAMVHGKGIPFQNTLDLIQKHYQDNVTDEFVPPSVLEGYEGMHDGDGLLMINFRSDRVRQILAALLQEKFDGFSRLKKPAFSAVLGMKEYSAELSPLIPALFPSDVPKNTLGEIISNQGLSQLRAAETEKYAHVTFFLNGGREEPYKNEERLLIHSPKVKTYDLCPEMSAEELSDNVIKKIHTGTFDLIVVNFANPDMVGHTGNFNATVQAVEAVDSCLKDIEEAIHKTQGTLLVTADHGNAECMKNEGNPHTAHTTNLVPFVGIGLPEGTAFKPQGTLSDIAPTVLALKGIDKPQEMTGCSLIID